MDWRIFSRKDRRASWSVVTTIQAPTLYVDRFVRHYLELGAGRLFMFFDDPDSPVPAGAGKGTDILATRCDRRYWDTAGGRPGELVARQRINLLAAQCAAESDWLLHVDGDELVHAQRPVSGVLAGMADDVYSVRMRPLEAVYRTAPRPITAYSTHWFKRRMRHGPVLRKLYGNIAPVTRGGLLGHIGGKCFIRSKIPIRQTSVHSPIPDVDGMRIAVETAELDLLHFEGLTFEDWRSKFMRRIEGDLIIGGMGKKRRTQIELVRRVFEKRGEKGLRKLYRRMHVFNGDRMDLARAEGFVVRRDV